MGKKTLEEIGKILLVSIISIFLTTLTTRRVLLDSKLDKIEYEKDKEKEALEEFKYRAAHKELHREEKIEIKADMLQLKKDLLQMEKRLNDQSDKRFNDFKDFWIEFNQ